tara:strand:+ start:280 stop:1113 length:834 start_codon:yes stop_codon:yes gene_type:complete
MDKINLNEVYLNHFPEDDSNEIYFEPISLSGLDEMHEYSVKEEFYEFFEFEPFKTIDETEQYLKKLINRIKLIDGDIQAMYWFVRLKDGGQLLGTAALVNINKTRESAEIGYGIDPSFWGKGYILLLQNALIKYTFETLKFNRLHGMTMVNNDRTISSVYAAGFKKEGIIRDYYLKDRRFIDGLKYSMLKKEFLEEINNINKINGGVNEKDIIKIISKALEEEVDINSTMLNTDNWDSIHHFIIIVAIQDQLNIKFPTHQISSLRSVKSIISAIRSR